MTRPESDENLTHDWHIDGEHSTATSLMYWCPDCLSMCHTRLDALCPDRVKRAMDRRFLAGVRAGLEAAARECEKRENEADRTLACVLAQKPNQRTESRLAGESIAAHFCASGIRAIDPTTLTEK